MCWTPFTNQTVVVYDSSVYSDTWLLYRGKRELVALPVVFEPAHDKINKMTCAPNEDLGQLGHPPSLIRVFPVRMKKHWAFNYLLSAQWRLWSDWADAQADLSLHLAHVILLVLSCGGLFLFVHSLLCHNSSSWYNLWLWYSLLIISFWPRQANLVFIAYASSEGSGEPAHPRSLARTFAARSYKQWVKRNLQTESQISDPSEWLGMRN